MLAGRLDVLKFFLETSSGGLGRDRVSGPPAVTRTAALAAATILLRLLIRLDQFGCGASQQS